MNALLTCELCHGHGYERTNNGKAECSACNPRVSWPWRLASAPPVPDADASLPTCIEVWGVVVSEDGRGAEAVAYWPELKQWTATRLGIEDPYDAPVTVTHWMLMPALPE